MLIAADIHGNLTCAKRLLKQGIGPSQVYILGDVLSNGVNEKEDEILSLIERTGMNFLRGNHEDEFLAAYSGTSKSSARHQRATAISPRNRKFLRSSPAQYKLGNVLLIHTPISPRRIKTIETALEGFRAIGEAGICFHGHYHHPKTYSYDPRSGKCKEEETLKLEDNLKYLINPGSLGINRTFLIYDPEQKTIRRYEL